MCFRWTGHLFLKQTAFWSVAHGSNSNNSQRIALRIQKKTLVWNIKKRTFLGGGGGIFASDGEPCANKQNANTNKQFQQSHKRNQFFYPAISIRLSSCPWTFAKLTFAACTRFKFVKQFCKTDDFAVGSAGASVSSFWIFEPVRLHFCEKTLSEI